MGRGKRNGIRCTRDGRTRQYKRLGNYYIVTDAEKTEKLYFEGLKHSIPEKHKGHITIKVENTETKRLIALCEEQRALLANYCEPWIVFDRDRVVNFDEIIESAYNCGIHVGWSNPCFEIWMLAYFTTMPVITDSKQCCKTFSLEYEKRVRKEYCKNERKIYKILNDKGNEENAIISAEKRHKQYLKEEYKPSEMFGCTTVHLLVKKIKQALEKDTEI